MDEKPGFSGQCTFHYKSYWTHLRDFAKSPLPIVRVAIYIFGVLCMFSEAAIQFVDASPRGWQAYCVLIAVSLVGSLVGNGYRYSNRVPDGFENVSCNASRIAHWQRPRWECQLAKTLLAQKLGPFDRELHDLNAGRSFVIADMPESLQAYMRWARTRAPNLMNMLAVAHELLVKEFPAAVLSTRETPAQPQSILEAVETLARFYGESVAFERAARSVMPSEALQRLHELQLGWSEPIRDGVHQLFEFLQQISECDLKADSQISFEITFAEPPNVEEYCQEIARLEPSIPELEEEW